MGTWDRLWRSSGIQFIAFFILAYVIYGDQPRIGASPDALVAFYQGNRAQILIAVVISGLNVLNLMWFAAALRTAGRCDLAYSVAGAGNAALTSAMNDLAWALVLLTSFPRAMLIMSGVFGFWRAGVISNTLFTWGVLGVVLGGTTWLTGGFWPPDGAYTRLIWPAIGLAWVMFVSWILLKRIPPARTGW